MNLGSIPGRIFNLLTVLVTWAKLVRKDGQRVLEIELSDDLEVCTSSNERRQHHEKVDQDGVNMVLGIWRGLSEDESVVIATPDHPLEFATADNRLVLITETMSGVLSFFRDIFPEGLTLPGGCPGNLAELLHLVEVARRELEEEVLIVGDGTIFTLSDKTIELAEKWSLSTDSVRPLSLAPQICSTGDADKVIIRYGDREVITSMSVFIDSAIGSVAVAQWFETTVPVSLSGLEIRDGEQLSNGKLLDRYIALIHPATGQPATLFKGGKHAPLEEAPSQRWISDSMRNRAGF